VRLATYFSMKPEDYTNRELDSMFKEIKGYLERNEEVSTKMLAQVTLTNGRVTKLEAWRESLTGKMIGAGIVIGGLWAVITKYT